MSVNNCDRDKTITKDIKKEEVNKRKLLNKYHLIYFLTSPTGKLFTETSFNINI